MSPTLKAFVVRMNCFDLNIESALASANSPTPATFPVTLNKYLSPLVKTSFGNALTFTGSPTVLIPARIFAFCNFTKGSKNGFPATLTVFWSRTFLEIKMSCFVSPFIFGTCVNNLAFINSGVSSDCPFVITFAGTPFGAFAIFVIIAISETPCFVANVLLISAREVIFIFVPVTLVSNLESCFARPPLPKVAPVFMSAIDFVVFPEIISASIFCK